MNDDIKIICSNIKKERVKKLEKSTIYSQEKISNGIGISKSALSKLENGNLNVISFQKLLELLNYLEIPFFNIFINTSLCEKDTAFEDQFNNIKNNNATTNHNNDDSTLNESQKLLQSIINLFFYQDFTPELNNLDEAKNIIKIVGNNIKTTREAKGISRINFSKQLGITEPTLRKIEAGITSKKFSIINLINISKILDINFFYLFKKCYIQKRGNLPIEVIYNSISKSEKDVVQKVINFLSKNY